MARVGSGLPADTAGGRAPALRSGLMVMAAGCRRHPWAATIALGCAIVNGACMVLGAKAIGWCTQHVVVAGFAEGRFAWATGGIGAAFVLGVSLLRVATIVGRTVGTGVIQYGSVADARKAVVAQYLRLGVGWHRRRRAGYLVSHAVSDTEMTWDPMQHFPFAVGMTGMLILVMIDVLAADLWLAAIAVVVVPLVFAANLAYQRILTPRAQQAQQRRAELSAFAHEAIEGRQVITTLGITEAEIARFRVAADTLRAANLRAGAASAIFDPAIELMPPLASLVILAVGVARIETGRLDVGVLVEIIYLLITTAIPLNVIARFLGALPTGVAGYQRLRETAAETEAPGYGQCDPPVDFPGATVELAGVGFGYAEAAVIRDISLRVPPGAIVAVVGPTGSGKTTLLTIIAHLLAADRGSVRVDGADTRRYAPAALRARTALVTQSAFLFGDTVRANVTLGAPGTDEEVHAALYLAAADEFVAALPDRLDTVLSETVQLSGGQRQRIALARAIFRNPRLLLLDDATSALDPLVERTVIDRLRRRYGGSDRRTTVILVGHRAATITLADTVVHLDAGRVLGHGPHAELLRTVPEYRDLVGAYDTAESAR
ncbi:ABC transporter ATP-binding protein [Nocardia sp. BMG111209]|uniref:ABC transporter ATP-binding protein n=1 Tax=Nocardia sp. BMG111209 TaxID=1160137 RepID=UPI0012DDF4C4|nr:ABC transporter ATP-binding protein [Nocardia sp. BMG111209]